MAEEVLLVNLVQVVQHAIHATGSRGKPVMVSMPTAFFLGMCEVEGHKFLFRVNFYLSHD